jgi:hypothetical protein
MKPFKPPTLVGRPGSGSTPSVTASEPPHKKRRISHENEDNESEAIAAAANVLKKPKPTKTFQAPVRKPLETVSNPKVDAQPISSQQAHNESYYTVLW